ncbi:hypothetical protein [Phormidesmis sp. 146-33]
MPLSLVCDLETTTCKAILERIKARAINKFGEKWLLNLVREYVAICGDEKATVINRRNQIERAFNVGSCNADTLIMLAAAVGCRFQMICVTEEIEDL